MRFVRATLVVSLAVDVVWAQPDPVPAETPAVPSPAPEPAAAEPTHEATEERFRALEQSNEELRDKLEQLEDDNRHLEERVQKLAPISAKLTGYFDFGFFSVSGDGAGIRSDIGYVHFPEYQMRGVPDSWVFMGDPLSTMVNARGDPGTTGESRAITFDGIGARTSTFLINSLNVALFTEVGSNAVFTAKFDLLPRGRDVSKADGLFLGDFVDVRLAYLEYRIHRKAVKVDLFAGKFDSVIGFEYRTQEAPSRIEVTPSLICRYTCGYPLGLKARVRVLDDALVANVAVTNGGHGSEGFPFSNEVDANQFKTVAGRLSYRLPFARDLELGVSGAFGAQDGQIKESIHQWIYGVDVHFHRDDFVFRAEFIQGRAPGESEAGSARCNLAPCLKFKGAYGLAGYRATNTVMPYLRVDWRDALHESGVSFVYVSELWRVTPGIRLAINENLTVKAEYTVNRELGRIPQFPNDVFTSSLVVKY